MALKSSIGAVGVGINVYAVERKALEAVMSWGGYPTSGLLLRGGACAFFALAADTGAPRVPIASRANRASRRSGLRKKSTGDGGKVISVGERPEACRRKLEHALKS
jgi:hypothetical protein